MIGVSASRAVTMIAAPPAVMATATEIAKTTEAVPFLEIVVTYIPLFGQMGEVTIQTLLIILSTLSGLVAVMFSIVKFFLKQK